MFMCCFYNYFFLVTVGCLILHQRYVRNFALLANLVSDMSSDQEQTTQEVEPESETEAEFTVDDIPQRSLTKPR